jgi:hypothetical protein
MQNCIVPPVVCVIKLDERVRLVVVAGKVRGCASVKEVAIGRSS